MIHSEIVEQIVSYRTVGKELGETLERLQNFGYKILNVYETTVSNTCSTQGFIVIYDDMEKTIMSNGQFIEILHDIQEMITTTEENNVCVYYNTTCCGELLRSIETVIEETLIELGENK